jgi:hypothetical protein
MVVFTIAALPAVPVINSQIGASGHVGAPFGYYINALNSPTSYAATNLPPGLSFNVNSITGTPTAAGTFSVPIFATKRWRHRHGYSHDFHRFGGLYALDSERRYRYRDHRDGVQL